MKLSGLWTTALALCLAAAALLPSAALAGNADAADEDKVEVVEFFWYGCPHCYRFQGPLEQWLEDDRPDNIEFRTVPALLSRDWEIHARAYYAAKLMGELDRFHEDFYDAIHQDGRRWSRSPSRTDCARPAI